LQKKFVCRRPVARKSSIGGLYVCAGGFDIENLIKTPLIYSVSYFNFGVCCFVYGKNPRGDGTVMQVGNILTNLIPNGPDPKSPAPLTTLPLTTKNFPKQKDLSRTEQHYVSRTAIKVNTTGTGLELLIAT